ncbi:DUF2711 family protein [Bacillus sp. B-jedd]|uniref:DUF2711 family protein n=1 Tax=Bacillus sp. B-jedd TaxID=1476857 RepID=UPI0005155BA8|nr:DUF2711 family protein [Bacillus sp. B-jedd]CEG27081.1 hypothetical protein BN1002_01937 [Bacillus sp. B-jedd]
MSETRIMPKPHRYAVCASEEMPIKEFYKGVFEEVFIFYHPFIKTTPHCYETWKSGTYLGKNNILEHCEPIYWAEFLKLAAIENVKKLDIGLRTYIGGLNEKFEDKATAKTIQDVCEKNKMIVPSEGFFSEFLINKILYAIKKEGNEWIWCGDEFGSERKLQFIDDLIHDDQSGNQRINLFTHDHEILLTTHWDSHFSLLCSDKETVKKIVNACNLEGFYCTDRTKIYWSIFD